MGSGARLILNSRYFRIAQPGEKANGTTVRTRTSVCNLIKYIATREGVDLNIDEKYKEYLVTPKQREYIERLIEECPEAKESLEYFDYFNKPTIINASEFISRAEELLYMNYNSNESDMGMLVDYIANRPGVQKVGSHGLFGANEIMDLEKEEELLSNHKGRIYTHVISLRKEDAEALGYTTQKPWRDLVLKNINLIAEENEISLKNLHWHAAMHNTGNHPHIHLHMYSEDIREGYIGEKGFRKIKSALAKDIFADDEFIHSAFENKRIYRDELKEKTDELLANVLKAPCNQFDTDTQRLLLNKLEQLALSLPDRGKHVYKLEKEEIKESINDIVNSIVSSAPDIKELYAKWCDAQYTVNQIYKNDPVKEIPITKNLEFRKIQNAVLNAACNIKESRINSLQNEEKAFSNLKAAVEESEYISSFTAYELGKAYEQGIGTEINISEAVKWYLNAAMVNMPEAQASLANLIEKGVVPEILKDDELVSTLYEKAEETINNKGTMKLNIEFEQLKDDAMNRNPDASYKLAKMYLYGTEPVLKDPGEASMWFGIAEANGNIFAGYELGKMYFWGNGIEQDIELGREYLINAYHAFGAELKDYQVFLDINKGMDISNEIYDKENKYCAYLESLCGRMCYNGEGVEQDFYKARMWFEQAANNGHIHSYYYLANMAYQGQGEEQSFEKAFNLYKKAADTGDEFAYYKVGKMYQDGQGTQQNLLEAASYYKKASELNLPYAQFALAEMFEKGEIPGIQKDEEAATALFSQALDNFIKLENENPDYYTEYKIGSMYLHGKGTNINIEEAVKWFTLSAEASPQAEYLLAGIYNNEENTEVYNTEKAQELYTSVLPKLITLTTDNSDSSLEYRIAGMYEKGLGTEENILEAIKWYEKSANNNNTYAQYRLGLMYEKGLGTEENLSEAVKWYTKAAELENVFAQYKLGTIYESREDISKSVEWYTKAADNNNAYAQYKLGFIYGDETWELYDPEKSQEYYSKALSSFIRVNEEEADPHLEYRIAGMYEKGLGTEENLSEAIKWYTKSAEQENVFAQYKLGTIYESREDISKSVEWYTKAADNNNAYAQYKLGFIYGDETWELYDPEKSQEYYSKALSSFIRVNEEEADPQLEYRIAGMYEKGLGTEENLPEAIKWYTKSAEQENVFAQYKLGTIYEKQKNIHKAIEWYKKAEEENNAYAAYQLGMLYYNEEYEFFNLEKAQKYYEKALVGFKDLENKEPKPQLEYRIAQMYEKGLGTEKNMEEALKWYEKSARNNNPYAQYKLGSLYSNKDNNFYNKSYSQYCYSLALNNFLKQAEELYKNNKADPQLEYRIAGMYENGLGTEKNIKMAVDFYKRSATHGNSDAYYKLGSLYGDIDNEIYNFDKSQKYYSTALTKFINLEKQEPDPQLEYRIAGMYEQGLGTEKNLSEAVKWYTKAAENKNSEACYKLGMIFNNNTNPIYNSNLAQKWYKKALDDFIKQDLINEKKGETNAQLKYRIAQMYEKGLGTEKNMEEAVKWYEKSASNNNLYADYKLGSLYNDSNSALYNPIKAQIHYKKSLLGFIDLENKEPDPQLEYRIGQMYEKGLGTEENLPEAIKWYTKSAEQENVYAQCKLGYIYKVGSSKIESNAEQSDFWYKRALNNLMTDFEKHPTGDTAYQIGTFYHYGNGVESNIETAREWYKKAASLGNTEAQEKLDEIAPAEMASTISALSGLTSAIARCIAQSLQEQYKNQGLKNTLDSKQKAQIRSKKQALGHNENENQMEF